MDRPMKFPEVRVTLDTRPPHTKSQVTVNGVVLQATKVVVTQEARGVLDVVVTIPIMPDAVNTHLELYDWDAHFQKAQEEQAERAINTLDDMVMPPGERPEPMTDRNRFKAPLRRELRVVEAPDEPDQEAVEQASTGGPDGDTTTHKKRPDWKKRWE